jgi:hypothetical protein
MTVESGVNLSGLGWGLLAVSCEHGNEPLDFMKGRNY